MTDPIDFNGLHDQLGLTKADTARAMGVHYQTFLKWQRGEQSAPAVAVQMARALLWMHSTGLLRAWIEGFSTPRIKP
ncbi:MAG: helix-turn-helix transcriptional regulator [Chromatiales bacterium]|nr:helix-turn-helix transcriptional regulator [Chromatiales bacterium]